MKPSIARKDWPQLLTLVQQALDVPATQRESWLRELAMSDAMVGALRGLLHERRAIEADDFLDALPQAANADHLRQATGAFAGGVLIGPWRLLHELGRGGMSTVWLAERADGQLARRVALKLPHAGPGQEMLARRMLRERNILAALAHPNIARLYEVGVTDVGTPYLVMELVEGDTLLAHADARRLTVTQRVALFRQVLDAVQYAHGKLVLHRDLKPGNILVTPEGQVKLLDFGIAKLLAAPGAPPEHTEFTRASGRHLTPSYASPEHLAGETLGTASDVYSLGVVLCELLCGQRPHRSPSGSAAQLESAILHDEPQLPSRCSADAAVVSARSAASAAALARSLRGDLDAIVGKALARLPVARYGSADALDADLARCLRGEPVTARRPGVRYYLGKFISRHRRGVLLGGIGMLVLLVAGAVAIVQGATAAREAARAASSRDFLLELFAEAAPDRLGGVELTSAQLLEQGRKKALMHLRGQPLLQAELLAGIGETQYQSRDMAGADAALKAAADLFRQSADSQREASARLTRLAVAIDDQQAPEAVEARLAELQPLRATVQRDHLLHLRWLCESGEVQAISTPLAALPALARCIEVADVADTKQASIALRARLRLAYVNGTRGRTADAEAHLRAAERLVVPDTPYAQADKAVGLAFNRAVVEQYADRITSTLAWLPASITACEASFGHDSPRCGDLKIQRAWALMRHGDAEKAVAHADELAPMMTQAKASYGQFMASYVLMRVFAAQGLTNPHLLPIATLERLLQPDAARPLQLQFQLPAMTHLAILRLRAGDLAQAQQWIDRADATVATLAPGQLPDHAAAVEVARALLLQARGEHAAALKAFGVLCDAPSGLVPSLNSLNCVRSLVALERKPQALALLRHALSQITASLGPDAPNTRRAQKFLAELAAPGYRLPPWEGSSIFISGIR